MPSPFARILIGTGPLSQTELLKAYVYEHRHFLINDGKGNEAPE